MMSSFVPEEYVFGSLHSPKGTSALMMNHTGQLCVSQLNGTAAFEKMENPAACQKFKDLHTVFFCNDKA